MSATGATGPAGTSTSTASSKASETPKNEESGLTFDSFEGFWKSLIGTPTTNEDGEITGTGIAMVSLIFLGVLSLFILFSTGSILSLLVFWMLVAVVIMVLVHYKYIDVNKIFGKDLIKRDAKKASTGMNIPMDLSRARCSTSLTASLPMTMHPLYVLRMVQS